MSEIEAPAGKTLGPRIRGEERNIGAIAGAVLDKRLLAQSDRPIAVAFSGGGDSLALLIAASIWTQRAGRPLIALNVDHGLAPESRTWADACAARAQALGVAFRSLVWTGAKPITGIEASARAARHRLIAKAVREAGARVILMGHNADDILEARAMRTAGSSTPEPREWGPSPAWPEGRGLFLLRPLLGLRRADIRAWLADRGETWIEDPANADPRFARTRARVALRSAPLAPAAEDDLPTAQARLAAPTEDGGFVIARAALRDAPSALAARFIAFASLSAAGTSRPPATERIWRLAERLAGGEAFTASLAGARIEADATEVRFLREAGERARGGLPATAIAPGQSAVWDGRFEISSDTAVEVRALAGLAARLPRDQQRALKALPPAARRALPALIDDAGAVNCPLFAPVAGVAISALAHERLLAAAGVFDREPD